MGISLEIKLIIALVCLCGYIISSFILKQIRRKNLEDPEYVHRQQKAEEAYNSRKKAEKENQNVYDAYNHMQGYDNSKDE